VSECRLQIAFQHVDDELTEDGEEFPGVEGAARGEVEARGCGVRGYDPGAVAGEGVPGGFEKGVLLIRWGKGWKGGVSIILPAYSIGIEFKFLAPGTEDVVADFTAFIYHGGRDMICRGRHGNYLP
jgi:hypothetical protein